jgi:predicted GNAT family acetyltransferase
MKLILASSALHAQIISYLMQNEKYCVTLMSRTIAGESLLYVFVDECKHVSASRESSECEVRGVISVSSGGQILHCLSDFYKPCGSAAKTRQRVEYRLLVSLFLKEGFLKSLFCIMGERCGTEAVSRAVKEATGRIPVHTVAYLLMEHEAGAVTRADVQADCSSDTCSATAQIPAQCEIVRCTPEMTDELFPLQEGFEKEEILFAGHPFDPAVAHFTLEHALKTQAVCAFRKDGKIIAKAGTNAYGTNYVQLGGVYTVPRARGHGYARMLIDYLTGLFTLRGKKTVLFVKEKNESALAVYRKCRFSSVGYFSIVYY